MDNQEAARLVEEYLQNHYYHIDQEWADALSAAYVTLTGPHEYVVQLESGAFLEWGDDLYIFPTLETVKGAVTAYEQFYDLLSGDAVVNLFQIIQADWDNGLPLE